MSIGISLRSKSALFSACVSMLALAAASPSRAADLAVTKAPVYDRGEFRAFIAGGAYQTGGDAIPYVGGFDALFGALTGPLPWYGSVPAVKPGWGWDGAVGADYRFAGTPWHVNMQGRYGQSRNINDGWGSDGTFASTFNLTVPGGGAGGADLVVNANATTTPVLRESHWQADAGVGYDFMRGAQINFGFRVAQIQSDIDFNTGLLLTIPTGVGPAVAATASIYERDRRSFLGAGPRIGIGGSVPIMGPLVFDYTADAAVLFGNTKWSTGQVIGIGANQAGVFSFNLTGLGLNQATWSSNNTVYNFDVEGGLGWWLTPNWKISATYRLDAFIDPLRTAPDDGANAGVGVLGGTNIGPGRSLDRFYHGPKVAVEGRF